MNWPDLTKIERDQWFEQVLETIPNEVGGDEDRPYTPISEKDKATCLLWVLNRFNPDSYLDKSGEELDTAAAEKVGIMEGSFAHAQIFPSYSPLMSSLILDVMDCYGGSKYKRWQAAKIYLRMSYQEVVTALSETDEDKRAAVILKKGEVFKSLSLIESEVDKLTVELFSSDEKATLASLSTVLSPESRAKAKDRPR